MTMRGAMRTMVAMAGVLAAVPSAAQAGCVLPPLAAGADSARAGGGRAPDVVIRATVTAAEVRFRTQPRASVRVPGCAGMDSVVVTERVNLPDPVQPGVTYRDVRVGIEIRTYLNVLCAPALAADPTFAALCAAATARGQPAGAAYSAEEMKTMNRTRISLVLCGAALLMADPAAAQDSTRVAARPAGGPAQIGTPHYDVVLEVPELSVDSIGLTVSNLSAQLALNANAANLVSITAGADVRIQRVELELTGVLAEAYVYVDLDNVARIVDRVLRTLGENPQLLTQLLSTVDNAVGTVGGVANTALQPGGVAENAVGAVGQTLNNVTRPGGLLTQTVNTLGQTVQLTLGTAGNMVEQTLDTAGNVVNSRTLGQVTSLPLVRETTNTAGQTVRQVRHVSGALLEYTLDRAGRVVSSRVLQAAPRR